jgi:hypothetical protein
MIADGAGQWRGGAALDPVTGEWRVEVIATDARGNQGRATSTIVVRGC